MRLGLQVRKNPFAMGMQQQPVQVQEMEMNEESKSPMKENIDEQTTMMINTMSGKSTATSNGGVFGNPNLNYHGTNKK